MSHEPLDFVGSGEILSECCGAPALGEISDDGFGICADCKEHAEFREEEEDATETRQKPKNDKLEHQN